MTELHKLNRGELDIFKKDLQLVPNEKCSCNKKLESIYGTFDNISKDLEEKSITMEFWAKEKANIEAIVEKGKAEQESTKMSFVKLNEPFTI